MSEAVSEPFLETRPLTDEERRLIEWMLEHGKQEARLWLPRLASMRATSWRCPCGCASVDLVLEGQQKPEGTTSMHIVTDFIFGPEDKPNGIFIFEKNGVLAGLEVYGLAGDASKSLPASEALRPC